MLPAKNVGAITSSCHAVTREDEIKYLESIRGKSEDTDKNTAITLKTEVVKDKK